jgi:adenylate cyclase
MRFAPRPRWLRGPPAWAVGVAAGLAAALACSLLAAFPPGTIRGLQLTLGDLLFVQGGGPELGYRHARGDIVVVTQDEKTGRELHASGTTPAQDLRVYRAVLAGGARAVGDDRILSDPVQARLLVAGLRRRGSRPLFRNIQLSSAASATLSTQDKRRFVGQEVLTYDSPFDANRNLRYYPLLANDFTGLTDETLAIKVARAGLGVPEPASVLPGAVRSGILTAWAHLLRPRARLRAIPRRRYALGDRERVPWVWHPDPKLSGYVSPAALWIGYETSPRSYAHYSYVDVLRGRVPRTAFREKVVLLTAIGATVPLPSGDSATWGEADAEVVQTVLDRAWLGPMSVAATSGAVVLLGLAGGLAPALVRPRRASILVLVALAGYVGVTILLYRTGTFPDLLLPPAAVVLAAAGSSAYRFVREELERRRILDLFGRYVPRAVADELVRSPAAVAPGGEKRELTILFADIRGFTAYSDRTDPEEVLTNLNAALERFVACAFAEQGTVDKYIGDAVMVLFNAPLAQPDHPVRAVRAARAMQAALADGPLSAGIGIHTGDAVIGSVGTAERLEYTAIGGAVNLAARLCENAGAGEIVVSQELWQRVRDGFAGHERPSIRVKGIDRELRTYRIV